MHPLLSKSNIPRNFFDVSEGVILRSDYWSSDVGDIEMIRCEFQVENFRRDCFTKLNIACPDVIKLSVPKRQAEFLAGRFAAKHGLKSVDFPMNNKGITIGKNRDPQWPNKIIGSITHSGIYASAIVSNSSAYRFIGLDIESYIEEDVFGMIQSVIASDEELSQLSTFGYTESQALTILFSAKECLFKSVYPFIREFFGFKQARLVQTSTAFNFLKLTFELSAGYSKLCNSKNIFQVYATVDQQSVTTTIIESY
jgi:enterobactin synthetase component D